MILWTGRCPAPASPFDAKPPARVVHWDTDRGLPPSPVSSILQTRDGYLWFGSEEGLARFDGVTCTIFDERNTPEMTVGFVSSLYEDREGALWVGTSGGGLLRRRAGRFEVFGREEGLRNEQVGALAEDWAGRLWVGTDGGGLYRREGDRFVEVVVEDGLNDRSVIGISLDSDGGMVVAYRDGLRYFRDGQTEVHTSREDLHRVAIASLATDGEGHTWVGSQQGLYVFKNGDFSAPMRSYDEVRNAQVITFGPDGAAWVGTPLGVAELSGDRVVRYNAEDGLRGTLVHAICLDHEGSIWVGHNGTGVDQIKRTTFRSLNRRQGLTHDVVTTVYQDRSGNMWIGTEEGLNLLPPEGGIRQFTRENGFPLQMVFTVCEDAAGDLWVGAFRGLCRYRDGVFARFTSREGLPSSNIWCSYRDRSGQLWIGTRQGLVRVQGESFEVFDHDTANLSHNDVRSICEDREGHLWVGTSFGLNRLVDGRFEQFRDAGANTPFKQVLALHVDARGDLWVGTMDKGLFRYRDGEFFQFSTGNGLHDNLVHQILEDDAGQLWLTCNRGVYSVSKTALEAVAAGRSARLECRVFDESDGLPTLQCNGTIQPAGWKDRDGRLWFATLKGVAMLDPRQVMTNPVPPPVRIDTVLVDGSALPAREGLVLQPGMERVEIRFAGLSFMEPRKVKFRYRLEGFDRDWVEAGELRSAFYTRLPAGRYQFQVQACNNDEVWNREGATLAVTVIPPWWQTSWFMALAFLAFTGSVAGTVRYASLRKYRRRMAELERTHELERERARIARDMHDGLGASLVKISLMGEAAETRLPDMEATRTHLQKISASARDVVRSLDEIVWAVNPRNDTLENLAHYVCHFAQEQFEFSEVRCHLDLPTAFPHVELSAECRHQLFLVIKEALNNVLKHAAATGVWVRFELRDRTLVVQVEDNGKGFAPREKSECGNGLSNMRKRMADQQGTWDIRPRPGGGTIVELTLSV